MQGSLIIPKIMQPRTLPVNKCYSLAWPQLFVCENGANKDVYIGNVEVSFSICHFLEQDHLGTPIVYFVSHRPTNPFFPIQQLAHNHMRHGDGKRNILLRWPYYSFVDLPLLNTTVLVKTSRMFVCT